MKHVRNEQVLVIDCRYPYEYDGGHITVSSFLCKLSCQALLFYSFICQWSFGCFQCVFDITSIQIDNINLNCE